MKIYFLVFTCKTESSFAPGFLSCTQFQRCLCLSLSHSSNCFDVLVKQCFALQLFEGSDLIEIHFLRVLSISTLLFQLFTDPFVSWAYVKECMQTTVRFLKVAYFRNKNLGLALSLHGDLNWCGAHSKGRAAVKISPSGWKPNGRYIKSLCLYLLSLPLKIMIVV